MFWNLLFKSRSKTFTRKSRPSRRYVPRFDCLEDRHAPAIVMVDLATDPSILDPGHYSLRQAIAAAAPGDEIQFAGGLAGQTIHLSAAQGNLDIATSLTITGLGASSLAVSGDNAIRVFKVEAGVTASITGLSVINGVAGTSHLDSPTNDGGGLYVSSGASVTISNCYFSGSSAAWEGGGIFNGGMLDLTTTTLQSNSAYINGGGLLNAGTLTMTGSSVISNTQAGYSAGEMGYIWGGAIYNRGNLTTNGNTIDSNTSTGRFAGLINSGTLSMYGDTVANNTGGGIGISAGTAVISNAIVSGNQGGGISNQATLTVLNTTVAGNTGDGSNFGVMFGEYPGGAGIFNQFGSLTVYNSTVALNSTGHYGGGILNNGGYLTVTNSTIYGNSSYDGGGIFSYATDAFVTTYVSNTTIYGNATSYTQGGLPYGVGGIYIKRGLMVMQNTIVVGNTYWELDHNPDTGSSHNIVETYAGLAPLADYGGPTQTMALVGGSPAIGAGGSVATLSVGINSSATTISVSAGAAIARTPGSYLISIDNEVMLVTNISGNSLTVDRGYAGTTPASHSGSTPVYLGSDQRGYLVSGARDIGAYQTRSSLAAPVQIGPSGSFAASAGFDQPTFTWGSVVGAHHYYLYVVDTTTGQAAINLPNVSTTSYTATTGLTPGHAFTWWVGADNASGSINSYNPAGMSFSLAGLAAPSQFGPSGTIAAAPGYDTPTFSWGGVSGANHYYLYVVDNSTGQAVINNPNVNATSYTALSPLTGGHQFTWYLGAISTNGQVNSYQPSGMTFTLADASAPIQIGPSGFIAASPGYDLPTFTWNTAFGANHYYLYLQDMTTGKVIIDNPSIYATSFTATTALTPGHNFTWWLGGISANGANHYLPSGMSFTLAPLPAPTQSGPSGFVPTGAGYDTPTFSWSSVSGANHYYVYVLDASTNQVVINNPNVFATAYTASSGLTPGHSFTWWLGAISTDGAINSYAPAGTSFTLAPLPAPMQSGPSGFVPAGAAYDTPTFSWSSVSGANHYYVYVLDASTNQVVINNPNVFATAYTATSGLTPGHSFTWWLGAISTDGAINSYAPAGMSLTLAPLPAPTQIGPNGFIPVGPDYDLPTFSWNGVTGASHYYVYVADVDTGIVWIDNPNVFATSYASPMRLSHGHRFVWYVGAISTNGAINSYLPSGMSFTLG